MFRKLKKLCKKAINLFKKDDYPYLRTSSYISYPSSLFDEEVPDVRKRVTSILKTSTFTTKKRVSFVDDSENQIKYYVPPPSICVDEFDTPIRKKGVRYERHTTPQIVITPPTEGKNEFEVLNLEQVEKTGNEEPLNPNVEAELDLALAELEFLIVELEIDAAALERQPFANRHRNPPFPLDLDAISIGYHSQNGRSEDGRSTNSSGSHEDADYQLFDDI